MEVYKDHNNRVLLLCKEGRKHLHTVRLAPSGVVADKHDKTEIRYWRTAEYQGKPYPARRALKQFRALGRVRGITKAAKELLSQASRQ